MRSCEFQAGMTVRVVVTAPFKMPRQALFWHSAPVRYSLRLGTGPAASLPLLHLTLSHTAAMENSDPSVNEKCKVTLQREERERILREKSSLRWHFWAESACSEGFLAEWPALWRKKKGLKLRGEAGGDMNMRGAGEMERN